MKKLIINRKKWLRGELDSQLLRTKDGKMCCLGFYSLSCGLRTRDIKGISAVPNLRVEIPRQMEWLRDGAANTSQAVFLMKTNDAVMEDDAREKQLASAFASNGVEVEFIN